VVELRLTDDEVHRVGTARDAEAMICHLLATHEWKAIAEGRSTVRRRG
jgi:hypothetical protein